MTKKSEYHSSFLYAYFRKGFFAVGRYCEHVDFIFTMVEISKGYDPVRTLNHKCTAPDPACYEHRKYCQRHAHVDSIAYSTSAGQFPSLVFALGCAMKYVTS